MRACVREGVSVAGEPGAGLRAQQPHHAARASIDDARRKVASRWLGGVVVATGVPPFPCVFRPLPPVLPTRSIETEFASKTRFLMCALLGIPVAMAG